MSSLRLLIIDDEKYVVEGLCRHVDWKSLGIEIAGAAGDGVEGIKLVHELRPDLVLVDVRMPEMDGISMIEKLQDAAHVPWFVVYSGYADFAYARKALHFGVVEYLLKPSMPSEIEETFRNIADKYQKYMNFMAKRKNEEPDPGKKIPIPGLLKLVEENKKGLYPPIIRRTVEIIKNRHQEGITLNEIAAELKVTPNYLSSLFSKTIGEGFSEYITRYRIDRAIGLIEQGTYKIFEISEMVGYNDVEYFRKIFKEITGASPSNYYKNR